MGVWEENNMTSYPDYFLTDHWKALKEDILLRRDSQCYICESWVRLLLHHVSYANLFKEKLYRDIYILCFNCHTKSHFWTVFKLKVPLRTNWLLFSMRIRKLIFYTQTKQFGKFFLFSAVMLFILIWNICAWVLTQMIVLAWILFTQALKYCFKFFSIAIVK